MRVKLGADEMEVSNDLINFIKLGSSDLGADDR